MTVRPDFFIAGAAKCGTTALFEYLSCHPSVFMPRMKEPKFFCRDLQTSGGVYNRDEYHALFAAAPAHIMTGEASAMYLYSSVAIERIIAHNPNAKIIVILRYPVDAAHSLHAARWSYGHESMASFEDAWRAQAARLAGEHMPPRWPDPVTLQYGAIYRYAAQVRRVLDHVPERQRHFVTYEEFFSDPRRRYADILEFLHLGPHAPDAFPLVNPAIGPRSHRLQRWLRDRPDWLTSVYRPVRPLVRATGMNPAAMLARLNSVAREKPALSAAFRAELDRYFADDIAELETLLGRRLWRATSPHD